MTALRHHILHSRASMQPLMEVQHSTKKAGKLGQWSNLKVGLAERIVVDRAGSHMRKQVAPLRRVYDEVAVRGREIDDLLLEDTGWRVGQISEVVVNAEVAWMLRSRSPHKVSEPQLEDMNGAVVCPDGTGDIEAQGRRGAQAHVEVAPCDVNAATARMVEWTLVAHA